MLSAKRLQQRSIESKMERSRWGRPLQGLVLLLLWCVFHGVIVKVFFFSSKQNMSQVLVNLVVLYNFPSVLLG